MTEITRKIEFDAGHRVFGHESKCAHAHGHRYVAEITVTAADLDDIGRVIDFSVVKTVVGSWIDEQWDHNFLINPADPLSRLLTEGVHGRSCYAMKYGNPTAENMARELFEIAAGLLAELPIVVTHVRIYETPNCWADYHGY